MNGKELFVVGLVFVLCFLVIIVSIQWDYDQKNPSGEFIKDIQVKAIYPRIDAYLNHMPPYIVTTDGEIYNTDDSLLWAKFSVNHRYTIRYSTVKISGRTGVVRGIVEAKP